MPIDNRPTRAVTDEERAAFQRDGVVLLAGIYPSDWVDFLEAQLTDVFDRQASRSVEQRSVTGMSSDGIRVDMVALANGLRQAQPGARLAIEGEQTDELNGRSIVETDAVSWHDGIRDHHTQGPLPAIVASLTASDRVNLYSDQLFLKEPGSAVRTPWHQDKPYFLLDGEKVAVCWVPVDRVRIDNGAMGYVVGSHLWNKTFKLSDFVTRTRTFPEIGGIDLTGLDDLPPIDAEPERFEIRYFDAAPGDVIVHNWATLHGSSGNVSASAIRRAASVRYAGDDVTFLRRASSPEPFRNTVSLADGQALSDAPRFPQVWPNASARP